tara:strand:+ start:207 stop:680 length:474 start_codon:yes stop_codon:yes gene_type:complete
MKELIRNYKSRKKKELILVIFQFTLIMLHFLNLIIFSSKSLFVSNIYLDSVGFFLILIGIIGLIKSFKDLRKNISPFPTPKKNGYLVTIGLYKFISHPMYYSTVLISLGNLFYHLTYFNFFLTTSLVIIFSLKIKIEENYLKKKYKNYQSYKKNLIF